MREKNDVSHKAEIDEEDFFSFDSDESADEDIIELIDVISETEEIDISNPEELAKLFDEEEPFETAEQTESEEEEKVLISGEADQLLDEDESLEDIETDLDYALQSLELSDEMDGELDFSESELKEAVDEDAVETGVFEHEEIQEPPVAEEDEPGVPETDMSVEFSEEETAADIDSVQTDVEFPPGFEGEEEIKGISEERIEAITTRVVLNVMEKITKETIAPVIEKVISDAIEALKESLESSRE